MRIITASVIIAALSLGTPAFVQAQGAAPSQPEAQTAVRSKVNEIISHTSDEEIQSLRKAIDANPEVAAALKAKGLNSSHVVAINVADGVLTMFTKTA